MGSWYSVRRYGKVSGEALADVLAPPDAILQSAIGRENGEVRQHR